MNAYCLKCKKDTKNIDLKMFRTKKKKDFIMIIMMFIMIIMNIIVIFMIIEVFN